MISTSDILNAIIGSQPFIEECLSRGIINYSAYAREVKPQIEKRIYKNIKEGAIVMALRRISKKLDRENAKRDKLNLTNLTVRSNLTGYTYLNSESLADKQRTLFNQLEDEKDVFCSVQQGIRETTFTSSLEASNAIERIFASETAVAKIDNLSSITIRLPKEVIYIPGVYYQVLKMLAWENLNIIEVLSTYTELTVIVETKDVDRAFSILKNLGKAI